jgi:hypothetical protein
MQVARKVAATHTLRRQEDTQPPLSQWEQQDKEWPLLRPTHVSVPGGKWCSLKEQSFLALKYNFLSQMGMCNLWALELTSSFLSPHSPWSEPFL